MGIKMPKRTNILVQNQMLYEKYRDFVIASFRVLNKHLRDGESIPLTIREDISITGEGSWSTSFRYEPMFYRFIFQHEKEIKQLSEFVSCIKWMLQDPITKKFHGKITDSEGNPVENPDRRPFFEMDAIGFLRKFVEQTKSFNFDVKIFNKHYREYEDYLYADELKFKSSSPLENFQCEVEEIDLGGNLKIRKFSKEEVEELWRDAGILFSPIPRHEIPNLKFIIETPYTIKKGEPISDQLPKEMFDKVISALRLFKAGIVGFNVAYSTPLMWSNMGKFASSGIYYKPFGGTQYKLTKLEIEGFREFWDEFKEIDMEGDFLDIAIRRFNYAYERERPEDKLIDYMTAFEALFSEGSGDLRYKVPLRVARLLETDLEQRKEIHNIIKAGYDARSDIVHGNRFIKNIKFKSNNESKRIPFTEFEPMIEEYLRRSIKEVIGEVGNGKDKKDIILERIDFVR